MKISRKDLRRIILENLSENRRPNLLKEGVNLNKAYRAGLAFKEDQNDDAKKRKAEEYKDQLEKAEKEKTGPFRPDKPRAEKARGILNFLNAILAADDPATVSVPEEPPEDPIGDDVPANTEPTPEAPETSEWKKYGSEDDWEYKIQGESPNQIWVTRKVGGDGKVFKLNNRRYKTTVEKLDKDDNMPKRSTESKANDPALKAAPPRSSGDQDTDTARASENEETPLAEVVLGIDGTQIAFQNARGYFGQNTKTALYEVNDFSGIDLQRPSFSNPKRYFVAYRMNSLQNPGQVTAAALIALTADGMTAYFYDKNKQVVTNATIIDTFDVKEAAVSSVHPESGEEAFFKGEGGVPVGLVSVGAKLVEIGNRPAQQVTESLSRGSLLRRRYWGRY